MDPPSLLAGSGDKRGGRDVCSANYCGKLFFIVVLGAKKKMKEEDLVEPKKTYFRDSHPRTRPPSLLFCAPTQYIGTQMYVILIWYDSLRGPKVDNCVYVVSHTMVYGT